MAGGCESCGDKEKDMQLRKLKEDAKFKAQEEKAAIAICQGQPEGYFLLNAFEAAGTGQRIVDVIYYVQQADAG